MKVSLIRIIEFFNVEEPIHPRDRIPSFELLNIAAFLEKNKIKYKHFDNEVMHLDEVSFQKISLKEKSDVFIIHFQPFVNQEVIDLIKKLKNKNKNCIVIVFSPIVDQQTELFLKQSHADFAVFGETEESVFELIEFISKYKNKYLSQIIKSEVAGIAFLHHKKLIRYKLRNQINLDALPFMAHHLLYENFPIRKDSYQVTSKSVFVRNKIKWGFLLSSRGCPFHCNFCSPSIRNSVGKRYRFQSAKRTADEIEYLVNNFGVNAISFEDDLFTINRGRVIDLCKEIINRKIKISWTVATRLDSLDLELLQWMKKAGCFGMSLGVESGSDRILALIKKGEKLSDLKRGMSLLHTVGIAATTNLIIGHPTETIEEIYQTLKLAKELKPVFIHLHYLTPYPGTEIFSKYQSKLTEFKDFSHWKAHDFNISAVDTDILQGMMKKMYLSYYLNFSYLKTYLRYRYQYYFYNFSFELNFLTNTLKYLFSKS
jgi:radical SAM superfamily enzyme YgiQ (UPF0313 family)